MRTPSRCAVLALAAAGALSLAACSSSEARVQRCQTASECPPASRCVSQACVANAAPVAAFAIPDGTIEANTLVTFDASASYDPDAPGDSVASYAWSFAPVDAPCTAPVAASTAREATVRFACAGTYSVTLVATDELSAASVPSTQQVVVAAYSGVPLVVVGGDVTTGHLCSGETLRCTATGGAIQLSATPTAAAPAGLSFRWWVEPPPDRPLAADRRVTFSPPSADVADPTATIETDGSAISGDWIFHIEARDPAGVVAALAMVVSVGNTPPSVNATIPASFPHAFSASLSQFASSGSVPFTVSDPDGDPLSGRTMEWRHSGDGGALFEGQDLGDHASFNVIVEYAQASDALFLRGGVDLARSIEFSIADVNGAVTRQSWPVVVGNEPPARIDETLAPVEHWFDLATRKYRADASAGTWLDPEGDPTFAYMPTGDSHCSTAEARGSQLVVHCELAYPGGPAADLFAGAHVIGAQLGDPWDVAPASTVAITVGNRAPVVGQAGGIASGTCTQGGCCVREPGFSCEAYVQSFGGGTGSAIPNVSDPDGDPLTVESYGLATYVAVSADDLLPVTAYVPAGQQCVYLSTPMDISTTTCSVAVSDGAASAAGTVVIAGVCG